MTTTKPIPTRYDARVKAYDEKYAPEYNAGKHPPARYEQDAQFFNLGAQEGYRQAKAEDAELLEALEALEARAEEMSAHFRELMEGLRPLGSAWNAADARVADMSRCLKAVNSDLAAYQKGGQQ